MAAIESKRSVPLAQPGARKKHSAISNQHSAPNRHRRPGSVRRKPGKNRKLPTLFEPVITRRGKTTLRRYDGRRFYRFNEIKGKIVDFVEVYLSSDYHSINVRFADKTVLTFVVEPGFTLETAHSDWKTGNGRSIKKWPLMHSESHRIASHR
jgi:hypothetical protein